MKGRRRQYAQKSAVRVVRGTVRNDCFDCFACLQECATS